jgi:RecJ-like exonuclease
VAIADLVPGEFLLRAERARGILRQASRARILCHYDPDGTTSAAILARACLRLGLEFHATMSTVLDAALAKRLAEEGNECLLVADMGSGQLDALEGLRIPTIVLDHHQVLRDSEEVVHVNPLLWGADGAHGACGATVSFLFAATLDEANWDLAGVALAGAIGDRQHVGGFTGWNAGLFAEAVRRKLLRPERRLLLRDGGVAAAVAASLQPYFAGLSGQPEKAAEAVRSLGLDPEERVQALAPEELRRLSSFLHARLVAQGANPEAVGTLVDDRYWIESESIYGDELTAYVNACCRLGEEALGMALCLGDREAFAAAEAHRAQFEGGVLASLRKLEDGDLHAMPHLQFFYHESATVAGSVAGIAMPFFLDQAKPVLGLATTDGTTKVSARGTKYLVARGLDLAAALREGAKAVGGVGGGHNVASGATIPKGREREFLMRVDEAVAAQQSASP